MVRKWLSNLLFVPLLGVLVVWWHLFVALRPPTAVGPVVNHSVQLIADPRWASVSYSGQEKLFGVLFPDAKLQPVGDVALDFAGFRRAGIVVAESRVNDQSLSHELMRSTRGLEPYSADSAQIVCLGRPFLCGFSIFVDPEQDRELGRSFWVFMSEPNQITVVEQTLNPDPRGAAKPHSPSRGAR
jgi:hypothetical protein